MLPWQSTALAAAQAAQLRTIAARVNPSLLQAGQGTAARYAGGGFIGDFADMAANVDNYASGGAVAGRSVAGGNTLSFHQLDLRTSAGTFRAGVSSDTMEGIRQSSLAGKLSQTGTRPSWYS